MQLEGSCHCGGVRFSLNAPHAYPFNLCYCSICRKTAGGGYAINLGGEAASLKVEGEENLSVYQAVLDDGAKSPARRHFCRLCGSALWLWDPPGRSLSTPLPRPWTPSCRFRPSVRISWLLRKRAGCRCRPGRRARFSSSAPKNRSRRGTRGSAYKARIPFRLDGQINMLVD